MPSQGFRTMCEPQSSVFVSPMSEDSQGVNSTSLKRVRVRSRKKIKLPTKLDQQRPTLENKVKLAQSKIIMFAQRNSIASIVRLNTLPCREKKNFGCVKVCSRSQNFIMHWSIYKLQMLQVTDENLILIFSSNYFATNIFCILFCSNLKRTLLRSLSLRGHQCDRS